MGPCYGCGNSVQSCLPVGSGHDLDSCKINQIWKPSCSCQCATADRCSVPPQVLALLCMHVHTLQVAVSCCQSRLFGAQAISSNAELWRWPVSGFW